MDFLRWKRPLSLLLPIWQTVAYASFAPGVVEVDLIFPRNTTFQPSNNTPIVFAIQNPGLISSLVDPVLSWFIEQRDAPNGPHTSSLYHLTELNFSTSDPYFLYENTRYLYPEGFFQIAWYISYGNCSHDPLTGEVSLINISSEGRTTFFTTKNGTGLPDLVAATDDDTCATSNALAWNITNVLDITSPRVALSGPPVSSCPVFPSITPTPTPCKVKINATVESSISSQLYSQTCFVRPTCDHPKNAAPGPLLSGSGTWLLVMVGWLAYTLNRVTFDDL